MGNCSSTGSKFNSQSRFFKATILDGDCTLGNSSNELGCGNLEVTRYELVLHQKGVQSTRWPYCRILKYNSKGDIFILESRSPEGLQTVEKRFFIVKGASLLCKFIQSQIAANPNNDRKGKPTGLSRSDDGGAHHKKENIGVLSGHNRMTSHPELDLAIGHYAPHHPIPAYFYNYGPPMQHYHVTPYPPYPNMAGPHPNFINAPQIIPMTEQWPIMPPHGMAPWQGPNERQYPTILPPQEEDSFKENARQEFSKALKKRVPKDQKTLASLKRKLDVLDLDTSNWTSCVEKDDNIVYDC